MLDRSKLDERPEPRKMDIRYGTWNARSLYRAGSLTTVAKELSKYKLDLVGVWEVRWDKSGTELAGVYTCFFGKGNENIKLDAVILRTSAVRMMEWVERIERLGR
jgi:hypothetical protein